MACGTPVITSNRSSLPEVVGEAALLVDPDDRGQLADAMARVAGEKALREDLRERGLKQAQRYSWDETARLTMEVYESVRRGG
jgi:glycosyltransferase involved in cell wall biosynthesis